MSTLDLLRATAPQAPDELRARVLALRPIERKQHRVRPVLVLAAAAALAVAAALVHGFSTSAPQTRATTTTAFDQEQATPLHGSAGAVTKSAIAAPSGRVTHTDA